MVVSLVELVSDLPDVSRYHDKVPVGEADQYVPVAVPSTNTERERTNAGKMSSRHHCGDVFTGERWRRLPAVGHNVSVVTLEGQFDSVFWVVDVEKHQNLFVHRYTDLKVSQIQHLKTLCSKGLYHKKSY